MVTLLGTGRTRVNEGGVDGEKGPIGQKKRA